MKNTKWFAVVLALTFLLSAALPAHAQADQGRFWYEATIWSDCANGGNGELIQLAGYMHVSFRFTFDNAGGCTGRRKPIRRGSAERVDNRR